MDPLQAHIRQVVFFDTPELTLSKAGVVVRARRIQGGEGDTVIKYGVDIGKVVAPIPKGAHAHVHNIKTKRW